MIIIPAIDIIDGKVVRLVEGNYSNVKNYSLTPLDAAKSFSDCGAKFLHVVDLDGAKSGNADNAKVIENIVSKCGLQVEVGGGIRTKEQIEKYLDCGVSRVILGTVAVKDFAFTESVVKKFGEKIAVGVDAKDGFVAVNGWKEVTNIPSIDFCKKLDKIGIFNIIYTDIAKDGKLEGTNLEIYKVLCQTLSIKITASGGVSSIDEIKKLKEFGVYATILGKSLYENVLDLKSAISVAGD